MISSNVSLKEWLADPEDSSKEVLIIKNAESNTAKIRVHGYAGFLEVCFFPQAQRAVFSMNGIFNWVDAVSLDNAIDSARKVITLSN